MQTLYDVLSCHVAAHVLLLSPLLGPQHTADFQSKDWETMESSSSCSVAIDKSALLSPFELKWHISVRDFRLESNIFHLLPSIHCIAEVL